MVDETLDELGVRRIPLRGLGGDSPAPVPSALLIAGARGAQATEVELRGSTLAMMWMTRRALAFRFRDWVQFTRPRTIHIIDRWSQRGSGDTG